MQQDSNFPYKGSEESSEPPQLPFPEPGQSALPVIPTTQTGLDALQFPFPIQVESGPIQVPFPQPLPSTETIDTAQIRFLQNSPVAATDEKSEHNQIPSSSHSHIEIDKHVQLPLSEQQTEMDEHLQLPFPEQDAGASEVIRIPQMPFPQISPLNATSAQNATPLPPQAPSPTAQTYLQQPLSFTGHQSPSPAAQPYLQQPLSFVGGQMSMPGLIEIPFATQAISAVEPSTIEQEESQPLAPSNQDAKRAIINGVISLVVSGFTIATIAGLAGLVVGTFAIIYGVMGLRLARHLPNKSGEGQAVVGIVLGLIAWCIVITASILRAPRSS